MWELRTVRLQIWSQMLWYLGCYFTVKRDMCYVTQQRQSNRAWDLVILYCAEDPGPGPSPFDVQSPVVPDVERAG